MLLLSSARLGADEPIVTVSLLTVAPGAEVYELDGHTGLRFFSPGKYDYVVNWGVFDFNSPNFLYRFVKGETDYMAWASPTRFFLEGYARQGREVTEQILNLTPDQTQRLQEDVAENLLPQNRTYRYNYIYDNCATRPFRLIESAIGRQLDIPECEGFVYGETGIIDNGGRYSFRGEMTRSHADYPWYQFGIDLALGNGLDKEITSRQRIYSPLYLKEAIGRITYVGDDGVERKLVTSSATILPGRGRVTQRATNMLLSPVFAAVIFLLITLMIAVRDIRRGKPTVWYGSAVYGILFVTSLLLTFLIFVSTHEATSPNWLYLWINPLTAVPMSLVWLKSCKRTVYCYQICNFVALFLLLAIGISRIQELNTAFYPLIIADMVLSAEYIYLLKR